MCIRDRPLEELHSKVLLPVDKLANFSEPLVWANDKGTLDEDENDDNPSLADISRDWKYEKLELDQRWSFTTWVAVISSSVIGMLILFCLLNLCLGRISRRSNTANLERRLDEAVGKYMYRGRKRQSAAGQEGRETHEMDTFLSGSSQDRDQDRDAPGARPSAPVQDVRSGAYPCLLYTSPSPRDRTRSRMPSSA